VKLAQTKAVMEYYEYSITAHQEICQDAENQPLERHKSRHIFFIKQIIFDI
jgi:hypothetical protein